MAKRKRRRHHVAFILPTGTGYRTVLKGIQKILLEEFNWEVSTLDLREVAPERYRHKLRHWIEEMKGRGFLPDALLLSELDLVIGFHKDVGGVPSGMISDYAFKKSPKVRLSSYRKFSPDEFEAFYLKRAELVEKVRHLGPIERARLVVDEMLKTEKSFAATLKTISKKYGFKTFGRDEFLEYCERHYGKAYLERSFGGLKFRHWMEKQPVINRLRYHELVSLHRIFYWSDWLRSLSQKSYPRELRIKSAPFKPCLPIPTIKHDPIAKLKGQRFFAFVRKEFNSEGELSLLRLMQNLPDTFQADFVGTTKDEFQKELSGFPGGKELQKVIPRVKFHKEISSEALGKILAHSFWGVKFSYQGRNSLGVCEMLSYGTPVFTEKRRIDNDILIHRVNGYLLPQGRILDQEIPRLVKYINGLIQRPETYEKMSRSAVKITKRLDIRAWVPRMMRSMGLK